MTENAVVPDGVVNIGLHNTTTSYTRVFHSDRLKSVELPQSVETISESAFEDCKNLETIVLPDTIRVIGDSAFSQNYSLKIDKLPDSLKVIGKFAFHDCESIEYLTIPYGVESIGSNAFDHCTSLINLEIPDSVTSLGDAVFNGCSKLVGARLPDMIATVGDKMFINCTSLRSIVIPDHVNHIGANAFENCKSLTSIEFPATLVSGGSNAFNVGGFYNSDGSTKYGDYSDVAGKTFVGYNYSFYEVSDKKSGGHLITFKNNDGTVFYSEYVKDGESIASPKNAPVLEIRHNTAYEFDGWDGFTEGMIPTEDMTFSAKWKERQLTVEFIWHDGSEIGSYSRSAGIESAYPANPQNYSESNRCYEFESWKDRTSDYRGRTTDYVYEAAYKMIPGYYIDFDLSYGSGTMERLFVKQNESATLPMYGGARDGYTFEGWVCGKSTYTNGETVPASDLTDCAPVILKAKWAGEKHKLTINYLGPTKDGAFDAPTKYEGLFATGATYGVDIPEVSYYTPSVSRVSGTMGEYDITIDVFYESHLYEITYRHALLDGLKSVYSYTMELVLQTPSTSANLCFDGWYTDAECKRPVYKIERFSTGDKTFYGLTKYGTREIEFKGNGADTGEDFSITATHQETTPAPANPFTREGYTFLGWGESKNVKKYDVGDDLQSYDVYRNTILYAVWKADDQFNLEINFEGIGTIPSEKLPANISRVADWNEYISHRFQTITDGDKQYKPEIDELNFNMPKFNVEITVHYYDSSSDIGLKSIYYELGSRDASNNPSNLSCYAIDSSSYPLFDPQWDGYTFDGWYAEEGLNTRVTEIDRSTNTTQWLYAKWIPHDQELDITYIKLENGTLSELRKETQTKHSGEEYGIVTPDMEGFIPDIKVVSGTMPGKKQSIIVTYYPVDWNIRYYPDTGNNHLRNEPNHTIENKVVLLEPTRKGYTFQGWYTEPEHLNKITEIEAGQIGNIRLYAKWTPEGGSAEKHKVIIRLVDPNGKTLHTEEHSVAENIEYSYAISSPHNGYDPESKRVIGKMGTSDVEIEIKLVPKDFTITLETGRPISAISGWTSAGDNNFKSTFKYGSAITLPALNYQGRDCKWLGDTHYTTMPDVNLVYVAEWEYILTLYFGDELDVQPIDGWKKVNGQLIKGFFWGDKIDYPAVTDDRYDISWPTDAPKIMPVEDYTVNATVTPKSFEVTITFENDAPTSIEDWNGKEGTFVRSFEYGSQLELPKSTDSKLKIVWSPEPPATMPAENLEFTGKWETATYEVTIIIEKNFPTEIDGWTHNNRGVYSKMFEYGSTITLPEGDIPGFISWGDGVTVPATMPDHDLSFVAIQKDCYRIALPSGTGYAIEAVTGFNPDIIWKGDGFKFRIVLSPSYDRSSPVVKVGDTVLEPVDGVYTIADIESDLTVTVSGIRANPSSGGGSGGSSTPTTPSKPDVKVDEDGTKTTTEKNPDGSVTETVEKTDGTTTVTKTEKDGSKTETTTGSDGSTVTKKTETDGSYTETATEADGSKTESSLTKTDTGTVETEKTFDSEGKETGSVEKKTETIEDDSGKMSSETVKTKDSEGKETGRRRWSPPMDRSPSPSTPR